MSTVAATHGQRPARPQATRARSEHRVGPRGGARRRDRRRDHRPRDRFPERTGDATLVAGYIAFAIFFLVGIGPFNFPVRWGLGRPDTTHEEELELAGKDEGVWRYFRFCTDHKVVGVQYLITVLVLFLVGGLASWMIRLEQAQSGAKVFTPGTYNTIVGMHGIIMIATTIIMLSAPFGNFIVPIMIGAKDMAFPRLNALSYWMLFPAVPILLSAIVLGGFPTGWTGYAPLADQAALGMDAYCITIILVGLSIALGAINIACTVVTMRAPGMTWTRLPIFVWSTLFSTALGLVVFPAFMVAVVLTLLDRVFGTGFYQASLGGNNWAYEQLFWFMGHPEVYVIVLPAIGAICEIVPVFTRKPLFGYKMVVGGMAAIFVHQHGRVDAPPVLVGGEHGAGHADHAQHRDHLDPDGPGLLRADRDDLARANPVRHADDVRDRVHRELPGRRRHRPVPGGRPDRHDLPRRHVHARALPLHARGHRRVRLPRRPLLLVPEGVRAPARRAAGEDPVLAAGDRLRRHVHAAVLRRAPGRAALAGIHRAGVRHGEQDLEPVRDPDRRLGRRARATTS